MGTKHILMQRDWTDQELQEAGFKYHTRKKQVVLARELPAEELL